MNSSAALAIATPQPAARSHASRDATPTDNAFSRLLSESAQRLKADEQAAVSDASAATSHVADGADKINAAHGSDQSDVTHVTHVKDLLTTRGKDDAPEGILGNVQAEVLDLPAQALSWAEHVMSRRSNPGFGVQTSEATNNGAALAMADPFGRRAIVQRADGKLDAGRPNQTATAQRALHAVEQAMGPANASTEASIGATASLIGHVASQGRPAPAGAAIDTTRPTLRWRTDEPTLGSRPLTLALSTQESMSTKLSAEMASQMVQVTPAVVDERVDEALIDAKPVSDSAAPLFHQMMRESVTDIVPRAINVPVGHANWGQAVGQQVVAWTQQARTGEIKAELRLDPPDMGPLKVSLHIIDGVTTASFASAHAAVRQALEQAMPQLQLAFLQAGLSLGDTQVGDSNQQGAGEPGSDNANVDDSSGGGASLPSRDASAALNASNHQIKRESIGLVDTFA